VEGPWAEGTGGREKVDMVGYIVDLRREHCSFGEVGCKSIGVLERHIAEWVDKGGIVTEVARPVVDRLAQVGQHLRTGMVRGLEEKHCEDYQTIRGTMLYK